MTPPFTPSNQDLILLVISSLVLFAFSRLAYKHYEQLQLAKKDTELAIVVTHLQHKFLLDIVFIINRLFRLVLLIVLWGTTTWDTFPIIVVFISSIFNELITLWIWGKIQ